MSFTKHYVYIVKCKTHWIGDSVICCHLTRKSASASIKGLQKGGYEGDYFISKHVLYTDNKEITG
jgi:hypothetical protein